MFGDLLVANSKTGTTAELAVVPVDVFKLR